MARKKNKKSSSARKKRTLSQSYHNHQVDQKHHDLHQAIKMNDLSWLMQLGRQPGGFLTSSLRRKIWPILLSCPEWTRQPVRYYVKHRDETQVALDVPRSLSTWPKGLTEKQKKKYQHQLSHVIVQTLRQYPDLHYYQGFHDICAVFLLVYENQYTASQLTSRVALFYLRDAMLESLDPILRELRLMDILITLQDPELGGFLQASGVLPFYCLSWVLTWFSHDLDDLDLILPLFDLFLSSTPMMPLYVSAALVLLHRQPLLLLDKDDPSLIHSFLCKLPQQVSSINPVIALALDLESRWDPLTIQCHVPDMSLDHTSVINTHPHEKVVQVRIKEAIDILALDPSQRYPLSPPTTQPPSRVSWLMVGAVSIGAAALFIAHHPHLLSLSWSLDSMS
ncbi:rab-GTPase-TBC domain-containing protein [Chlamydoabsidia padenii]|nr:rab-GTPase-TBC domain-containing protein [Chlamydoabsidia padenii]